MKYTIFILTCFSLFSLNGCLSTRSTLSHSIDPIFYSYGMDTITPKNITHFILMPYNRVAISTTTSLSIIEDHRLIKTYSVENVSAMLISDDTLFIGSSNGLFRLTIRDGEIKKVSLPAREHFPKISSLAIDLKKRLWVGTEGYGAFSLSGDIVRPYSLAPYISSVAVTRDSSVWAGSNVGVFRIFTDGETKRYYEEIPANGIAIPDNIVEHMNVDNSGHLWIFMSQAVSVLTPDDYEKYHTVSGDGDVDPHTFAFLGSPSNHINKFIQHRNKSNIWWAISTEGLFVVSDVEFENAPPPPGILDKIEEPKANLRKVSGFQDEKTKKEIAITDPTDLAFDDHGNLWISSKDGLFKINEEILHRFETQSKMHASMTK